MAKRIPLEGHKFGLVEVVEFVGMNERRNSMYKILCLCGETRIVRGCDLTAMAIRKCGADCQYERPKFHTTFRTLYDGTKQ